MTDAERRVAVVTGLCEVFARPAMSDAAIDLYLGALADVPVADLERAASRLVQQSRFFPKPAELREAAGHGVVAVADKALRAWADARNGIHEIGAYASVTFVDKTAARTIEAMGGWIAFCKPSQDEEWQRKEFLETYRAMDGAEGEAPARFMGLHEAANGRPPRNIVSIGPAPDAKALPSGERTADQSMAELQRRMATRG